METCVKLGAAGFKDPAGQLFLIEGRAIRAVTPGMADAVTRFAASPLARRLVQSGHVVPMKAIRPDEAPASLAGLEADFYEHPVLPFINYPFEWSPAMLHAAAELTLDLATQALEDGYGIKDATPANIVFEGPHPRFVDWLSFEERDPADPVWLPYAQFTRTFLLPLLAHRRIGWDFRAKLLTARDGLEPEAALRLLPWQARLRPPLLQLAAIPVLASRWVTSQSYERRRSSSPEQARFILRSLLRGLRKHLGRVRPGTSKTVWTEYARGGCTYEQRQTELKEEFVREALRSQAAPAVLDVGCNTGRFSRLALEAGAAEVVAIDTDEAVVDEVWRDARANARNILPLVIDLARPTPASGWRNEERKSFLDRSKERFDVVLMLAVIHHLAVTERAPLDAILELAAHLTRGDAVIEFVGREDSMFQRLLRGRGDLHRDWSPERFERAAEGRFKIVRRQELPDSHRILYHLAKRR